MRCFLTALLFFISVLTLAQVNRNDTIRTENHPRDTLSARTPKSELEVVSTIENLNAPYTKPAFSPTKAGLYSAVLPGLGQFYNKKYWKIPIAWGAIGAGVGITIYNDKRYRRYRNAFVSEINGVPHEFSTYNIPNLKEALGRQQDLWKRNRDYAIAATGLIYILNIVDAVVDAHLYEGRNDPDLVIRPTMIQDDFTDRPSTMGVVLNYKF
ncbi:hypothetical protein H1R16_05090 [Marnyiella aurantia]|uniref:DUF5683 domain-containing protein n=1 Tax=Marnyiella aurantia TaxID=2758037 RepID=A0A7D7QFY9_9FLAO|nr:DUF5683 domain-containing protein [Marnyiella aurantia]MBA5247633.1 hypothetical protein [Marnyiella aurantia]QMS99383.1 hypothetical protein H1R16_05090 [Marnyiella aurantia]